VGIPALKLVEPTTENRTVIVRRPPFLKPNEPLNAAIARLIVTVIRADIRAMPAQASQKPNPHYPPGGPPRRPPQAPVPHPVLCFAEAGTSRGCGRPKSGRSSNARSLSSKISVSWLHRSRARKRPRVCQMARRLPSL
jgi:hypothetical protein